MRASFHRLLRFADFMLDASRGVLLRGGEELPRLRRQSFEVLRYLAEHPREVISNDRLVEAVWVARPSRPELSVGQCIKEIRQTLGVDARWIVRTVSGGGYEFMAEVVPEPVAELASSPVADDEKRALANPADPSSARERRSSPSVKLPLQWQRAAVAGSLLAILLLAAGWLAWRVLGPEKPLTMMAAPSIAILPVKPLGDNTDGAIGTLADEIATGVWRAPRGFHPRIPPPSSAKHARGDARAIGRTLDVRYIVQTSARRDGDLMHLNVQIIEAATTLQLWVGPFQYRPAEPGAQGKAAALIGRTIVVEVLRAEVKRPLPDRPVAAHFVMLGRPLMSESVNAISNAKAIALFEKALEVDPTYTLALGHLARSIANHALTGWMPPSERTEKLAKAEAAIKKVVELEPRSATAHVVYGNVLRARSGRGDSEQAIKAFEAAIGLDENLVIAHAELGRTLIDTGQPRDALRHLQKAIELSPHDISVFIWKYWAGLAALHVPDPKAAVDWLRQSLQDNPVHDNTLRLMAVALADDQQEEEALQKVAEFMKARRNATAGDWAFPGWGAYPEVEKTRKHIRATLIRLGVPEVSKQAASTP